jgi:prepilin-type N-terminal cleavage/methylation domain-containing protein
LNLLLKEWLLMSFKQVDEKGFTLIEIAIVLVIVGLLVGGAVPLMTVLSERKVRNDTLDYMNEARAALISFAKINGRLPWADTTGDGVSDANQATGTLPFQTLGIRSADSQGRRLKYELNGNLGTNLPTGCHALQVALTVRPFVVDSDGTNPAFPVAAVLVSSGLRDADGDGSLFDSVTAGIFQGNNVTGNPNYIRNPPSVTFDDLVVYIDQYTLFGEMCGNPQLAVSNSTAANVFVHNQTTGLDVGIVPQNSTISLGILSGSQIVLRNAPGGGGAIVASTPAMPPVIAGSGIGVTVP